MSLEEEVGEKKKCRFCSRSEKFKDGGRGDCDEEAIETDIDEFETSFDDAEDDGER